MKSKVVAIVFVLVMTAGATLAAKPFPPYIMKHQKSVLRHRVAGSSLSGKSVKVIDKIITFHQNKKNHHNWGFSEKYRSTIESVLIVEKPEKNPLTALLKSI